MTRLFRRQSKDWCLVALNFIEDGLSQNLSAANNSAQGGVSYSSLQDAMFKIDQLNMRIDELDREDGLKVPDNNAVIVKAMWGRRAWR
ncbi:hypothetical protein [Rhizobium laguerreae]|uniref:hypothetical protein n=1 Tax=Rhizobium laguerreae TaxID=1076926 RepID=UPI001C903920|nr:hypothetical protein [Rhizobium laguerreae]MBY3363760.1 hypothetical protein [Rhizobium laguerreae]